MIYFDHASGGIPSADTIAFLSEMLRRYPCNQEAVHAGALDARKALRAAGEELKELLRLPEYGIVWGNSATELFLVLSGCLSVSRRGKVLLSRFNHPALNMSMQSGGASEGVFLRTRPDGCDLADLSGKLTAWGGSVAAVALPQINSELGLRFQISEIGDFLRENAPDVPLVLDAVQAFGKEPIFPADAVIVSGHKLGVPSSAALLFRPRMFPTLERFADDFRHKAHMIGRPEIPALLTMVHAAQKRMATCAADGEQAARRNAFLRAELTRDSGRKSVAAVFPIPLPVSSPWICGVLWEGLQSAILLRMLSAKQICVGAGAACEAESGEPSAALAELGFRGPSGRAALRISFSPDHTDEEVKLLVDALRSAVADY